MEGFLRRKKGGSTKNFNQRKKKGEKGDRNPNQGTHHPGTQEKESGLKNGTPKTAVWKTARG